jgi:protein-S-isoprenylcysteine O-methyltransferase Ste14
MDRGTIWRVWLPLIAGLWAFLVVFQSRSGPHGHGPARWIGLVLGLIGLGGVVLARYTLGRSFSVVPKATALVTTGIYSRIRNPIYISGMICVLGMVLLAGRPELLAIFLVIIPMQIIRARREAAVLEAKFGDAYREYRKQTWF